MIAFIRGRVYGKKDSSVIIDAGNLGYEVFVPDNVLYSLSTGEDIRLFTYYHYREEGITLYGFMDEEDKNFFEMLININGVGPKMAIGMLSAKSRQELILALANERVDILTEINGIGAKTAKRIILELKDKILSYIDNDENIEDVFLKAVKSNDERGKGTNFLEALDGLASLGYTKSEVEPVIRKVMADNKDMTTGQIIMAVLQKIGEGRNN